jgi:signal transduction histidine kinase
MLKNIRYDFQTDGTETDTKINPEVKRNVYLIFKESLNNIIKHSSARNVTIRVTNSDNRLNLQIADDGIGFEQTSVIKGNGLYNLSNRAEQIGAELKIISSPGKGTTININTDIA